MNARKSNKTRVNEAAEQQRRFASRSVQRKPRHEKQWRFIVMAAAVGVIAASMLARRRISRAAHYRRSASAASSAQQTRFHLSRIERSTFSYRRAALPPSRTAPAAALARALFASSIAAQVAHQQRISAARRRLRVSATTPRAPLAISRKTLRSRGISSRCSRHHHSCCALRSLVMALRA